MADRKAPPPRDVITHRNPRLIFSEAKGKIRVGRHSSKRCEAVGKLLCFMAKTSLARRRVAELDQLVIDKIQALEDVERTETHIAID